MCGKLVYLMAFVMLLGVVGSVSADSLVAHWEFTEGSGTTAYDSTDNNNDGTLYNGPAWGQQICPELSASLSFDGSNDYVRVPDSASMHFGTNPFTIAFYMKTDGSHGGEILINGTSGPAPRSGKRYEVTLSGGAIQFAIDDNVEKIWIQAAFPADQGWHHVVCRRFTLPPEEGPGQGLDIWVDGVRKGAGGASATPHDLDSPGEDVYIATCTDGTITHFPGELRDVRLYDYAIGEETIATFVYASLVPWCPAPVDEAANIAIDTDLTWNVPTDANKNADGWTYEVYVDTDSTFASTVPVTVGPFENLARGTATNAEIGGPLSVDTYYWRVDTVVDPNEPYSPVIRTGDVWSFDASATLPELIAPAEGSSTEINVDLVWSSDDSGVVTGSRVYIKEAAGSWINLGVQASPFNPYTYGLTDDPDLLTMKWNTGYTWKVEELDSGNNVVAAGPDWHFNVRALVCELDADIDGSGDCFVNLADFAVMASEWLDCNWDDGGMASPCP